MDLDGIIGELLAERKRLDRMIRTLEQQSPGSPPEPPPRSRRGRKSMDSAARQEVSERMKQYWAKRREQGSSTGQAFPADSDSKPSAA